MPDHPIRPESIGVATSDAKASSVSKSSSEGSIHPDVLPVPKGPKISAAVMNRPVREQDTQIPCVFQVRQDYNLVHQSLLITNCIVLPLNLFTKVDLCISGLPLKIMEFDLEMSNAAPVDFPEVLSDAESVVQLKAASGEGCATPEKSGSTFIPECDELFKPAIGMTFDDIESAKEFYKAYAGHVGFSVRVGQHKAKDAKQSSDAMQLLRDGVFALGEKITEMVLAKELSTTEEFEEFLGCQIPSQVDIHPPNDIRSKGRIKRIKGHADKGPQQNKNDQKKKKNKRQPRKCRTCKNVVLHDARNCPNKAVPSYKFRNGLGETAMGVVAVANSEND
ncbi:hypothetical protein EJB05_22680 [Eragrostis curvula]|uniref:Protein FAR1-RELATED SEQUENCE n=1 Tax=Eragrostis curvula TaxID=38414 RepID=A0A5J9V687_9POAL|nr:hypothetical protein EJB05_22680 [Eragrostis curvula]